MTDAPRLPSPVANDWVRLLDVFLALTSLIGDPEEALHDIRRALVRGEIRSLRRQTFDDGVVKDSELARTFWRDFKFRPARDKRGRETISLHPVQGVKFESRSLGIFYLHHADSVRAWPELAPVSVVKPKVSKRADTVIREEIAQVYARARADHKKPPNVNELPGLVQPRVRERGHEVTLARIQKINKEEEFQDQRVKPGKRWS